MQNLQDGANDLEYAVAVSQALLSSSSHNNS